MYSLIQDIEYIERTLLLLKQSSLHVDKSKFYFLLDVTIPISDYWVDWNNSSVPEELFKDKFKNLQKYADWFDEISFKIDHNSEGALENSIKNMHNYNVDAIIYLDADVVFNPYTLYLIVESFANVKEQFPKCVITPEYVKLQDNTWDILVNENFINKPYNYMEDNDSITDSSLIYGDNILEPLFQNNSKVFKFGGGWFTLLSKDLLDYLKLPEDIKGYCPIDTFIMSMCYHIPEAIQFKIKNLVVCEDKKYTNRNIYNPYIEFYDRKMDQYQKSWDDLIKHKDKLIKNKS